MGGAAARPAPEAGTACRERRDRRAWQKLLTFLDEVLG